MINITNENNSVVFYIDDEQVFKDWCWNHQYTIDLPTAMREGGSGTWEIIE